MNNPLITIIIPIYNNEKYMHKTMDSLLNQTYKEIEVLCIDDFSTDNSINILQEYVAKDNRVKLIRRTTRGYLPTPSIILGVEQSKGEYFYYLSQDDFIDEDCLEKSVAKALEVGADIVSNDMVWYYEDKPLEFFNPIVAPNKDYATVLTGREAFEQIIFDKISAYALIKMDLVKKVGFDTMFYDSCDYATKMQFLNANKVAFVKSRFYYRQDNVNAITKGFKINRIEMVLTGCRVLEVMIKERMPWKVKNKFLRDLISIYSSLIPAYKDQASFFSDEDKDVCREYFYQCNEKLKDSSIRINPLRLLKLMKLTRKTVFLTGKKQ